MRHAAEEVERDGEHDGECAPPVCSATAFGHELAEHDREVREDRERDQELDAGRERRLEEVGDQRLADRRR